LRDHRRDSHADDVSPYLPVTPQQIADSSIEAAKAGAAILHLVAREKLGTAWISGRFWRLSVFGFAGICA
jgi:hypothetical protein